MIEKKSEFDRIKEFYNFLQGKTPERMNFGCGHQPKLSQKQAFSVIYYLQEHFAVLSDNIEKCSNCGCLYDSDCEGLHWQSKDKYYCGFCMHLVPKNYDRGKR